MQEGTLILLIVFALGVLGKNPLITLSAGSLLVIQVLDIHPAFRLLNRFSMPLGLIFLLVAVLLPVAEGELTLAQLRAGLTSTVGVAAFIAGATASFLSARGVNMLTLRPDMIVGLLLGTLCGILFLGGIPVGPLTASGMAAALVYLVSRLLS